MEIYCGLCGHKDHELFSHLRQVHEMSADKYRERCPNAPLISDELADYMREQHIVPDEQPATRRAESDRSPRQGGRAFRFDSARSTALLVCARLGDDGKYRAHFGLRYARLLVAGYPAAERTFAG